MTKLSFTLASLVNATPCYDGLQRLSKSLTGPYAGTTVVNYYDNVEYCETSDLLWALNLTQLTDDEIRTISTKVSIYAARSVLHLFENEVPNDPRPRRAIETAEACVTANFSDESIAASEAATWSAMSAAWAAEASAAIAAEASAVWSAAVAAEAAVVATWSARAAAEAAEAAAEAAAIDADPSIKPKIKNYALELIRSYDNE